VGDNPLRIDFGDDDIPSHVHVGTIQHFLYLCANHTRRGRLKTLKRGGEAVIVVSQTENMRRIHAVNGRECWIRRATIANREAQKSERLRRKRERRKIKVIWIQPCWTGEPHPADRSEVPIKNRYILFLESSLAARRIAYMYEEPCLKPRESFNYAAPPRIRPRKFKPQPLPYEGGFSIQDITAQIGKHRWSDDMNRAVYDLFVTNETDPHPLSAAQIAEKWSVHVRSLYTYSEKMRQSMPKRAVTETIFIPTDGALNGI
jgi:hypothetical protein